VSVLGAEILYRMGQREEAIKVYQRVLDCDYYLIRTVALASIDNIGGSAEEFLDICKVVPGKYERRSNQYDIRAFQSLLKKWDIDPATLGI
jgi:tetratricopeptide (TPR) repeat protein